MHTYTLRLCDGDPELVIIVFLSTDFYTLDIINFVFILQNTCFKVFVLLTSIIVLYVCLLMYAIRGWTKNVYKQRSHMAFGGS